MHKMQIVEYNVYDTMCKIEWTMNRYISEHKNYKNYVELVLVQGEIL